MRLVLDHMPFYNNSENLDLREDPNKGVIVNGITEMIPKSSEHILNILKKGNKNRTTKITCFGKGFN